MSRLTPRGHLARQLFLVVVGVFVLLPIWVLVLMATDGSIIGYPSGFHPIPVEPTLERFATRSSGPGAVLDYWGLLRNSLSCRCRRRCRPVLRRDDGVRVRTDAVPGQGRGTGRDPARRVPAADRPRGAAVPPVQRDRAQRPARERVRAPGLAARALDPLRLVRDAALPVAHARGVPGGARGAGGGRVRRRRHALHARSGGSRCRSRCRRSSSRRSSRSCSRTRSSRSPGCSSRPTRT